MNSIGNINYKMLLGTPNISTDKQNDRRWERCDLHENSWYLRFFTNKPIPVISSVPSGFQNKLCAASISEAGFQ
jgi:hypothetical protein